MNDERLTEKKVSADQIFLGKILNVQKWTVTLPNGSEAKREIVLHAGAAAVLPLDDDGYTYLVRQYRCPFQKIMLEVPAGKLDRPDEDKLECAKRELKEETGFTADNWTSLGKFVSSPGFCNEEIGLFLARGLHLGNTEFDEDEFLDIVKIKLEDALKMLDNGELDDGKTVCALLMAQRILAKEAAK